jgi:hypothetical protein
MTKGTIPGGATFDQAQDEFFERSSKQALRDMSSTTVWPSAQAIWIGLAKCWPATRQRILMYALRECSDRHEPPPKILVDRIEAELAVSAAPRLRAKDASLIEEVAHYLVRNPRESRRKIAAALGRPNQTTTIHRLFKKPEFWAEVAEQSARFDEERKYEVLRKYTVKFGQTFEYATEEVKFAALSCLVPSMIEAIEDTAPPLTNDGVRLIALNQSDIRSVEALKRRLMPVAP